MEFFDWLFGTRTGVLALFVGGIIIALLIAWILEHRLSKRYYNHEPVSGQEDDSLFGGLFESSEDDDS